MVAIVRSPKMRRKTWKAIVCTVDQGDTIHELMDFALEVINRKGWDIDQFLEKACDVSQEVEMGALRVEHRNRIELCNLMGYSFAWYSTNPQEVAKRIRDALIAIAPLSTRRR